MKVSVICPVYDTGPDLLHHAVMSVLNERTGHVREIILVDDGSRRPDTRAMLDDLRRRHDRVQVRRADRNIGPARARNLGLAMATGDWIAFLDADDLWLPDHLAAAVSVLRERPGTAWIATNHDLLGEGGERTPAPLLSEAAPGQASVGGAIPYPAGQITHVLIADYWMHLGGCVVRADLLRRVQGFDESCTYSEDWLLFLRLSLLAELLYVPRSTYLLRRTHASFTTSSRRLTAARASGKLAALRRPELAPYRRNLRWALLSLYKGLAANNLMAGNRARAALFAAKAWMMDPREIKAALRFAGLLVARDRGMPRDGLRWYSKAEIVRTRD